MTLYEIDTEMYDILSALEPDEDGMLPENYEELMERLQNLDIQRQKKLENVAKYVLNTRAEATALREEEKRLASRRKTMENREKSLMAYLDNACMGEKTDLGIAVVSYRRSTRVEIKDTSAALEFLEENNHEECIKRTDPEIAKDKVKALVKDGTEVPGIAIVEVMNCSLR